MISTLIIEVKYIVFGYRVKELIQIQQFINIIELEMIKSIILYSNNKVNITLTKNAKSQYDIKHIDI